MSENTNEKEVLIVNKTEKIIKGILIMLTISFLFAVTSCKKEETEISAEETRNTVSAIEGTDYKINEITVAISDSERQNGNVEYISYDELRSTLETRKEAGVPAYGRITVKYTAAKELSSFKSSLRLNFWSYSGDGRTTVFTGENGNEDKDALEKNRNIKPGVHYIHIDFKIKSKAQSYSEYDIDVIENLDAIDEDLFFEAYIYR